MQSPKGNSGDRKGSLECTEFPGIPLESDPAHHLPGRNRFEKSARRGLLYYGSKACLEDARAHDQVCLGLPVQPAPAVVPEARISPGSFFLVVPSSSRTEEKQIEQGGRAGHLQLLGRELLGPPYKLHTQVLVIYILATNTE